MVKAKFVLNRIEITKSMKKRRTEDGTDYAKDEKGSQYYDSCELRTLVFNPVYANNDPKHENSRFWDSSPSGEIKLGTVNPDAWNYFELGKEYYVNFEDPQ